MIYIFRKEMKKWHSVLWVVFASLAASTFVGYLVNKSNNPKQITIAKVNGQDIKLFDFQKSLNDMRNQIEMYKDYARRTGISMDLFLSMAGLLNPEQAALDSCINNKIFDIEKAYYNIDVDQKSFEKELIEKLPEFLKDASGNINLDVYRRYLMQMNMTPSEFEDKLQHSLERETYQAFLQLANYIPTKKLQNIFTDGIAKKSFSLVKFNFDDYLKKAENQNISDVDVKNFFDINKENYRIPEKRAAAYWFVKSADYTKNILIDDSTIESFYEKNKSSLFRIAPKVKVRHIFFQVNKNDSAEKIESVLKTAKDIKEKVESKNANFADMAKQYSQDTKTVATGGLVNYFEKGTYDPEFEKAALRLQKEGEISDIVKVANGFELIQLEHRLAASSKPLDQVRDEIEKTLKAKKSLTNLRAELQKVIHEITSNETVLASFLKENNLKQVETKLLENNNVNDDELEHVLVEKIFASDKKQGQYGFFAFKQDYVLFKVANIQKSYIPTVDSIKANIIKDMHKNNAKKMLKNALNVAKRSILDKKQNLKIVAESLGTSVIETKAIKKLDKLDDLAIDESFNRIAFMLDSNDQVLSFKDKSNYYLVQLKNIESTNLISFADEKIALIQSEKEKEKGSYLQAFIASLLRNARIEKFEKYLNASTGITLPDDIDV